MSRISALQGRRQNRRRIQSRGRGDAASGACAAGWCGLVVMRRHGRACEAVKVEACRLLGRERWGLGIDVDRCSGRRSRGIRGRGAVRRYA